MHNYFQFIIHHGQQAQVLLFTSCFIIIWNFEFFAGITYQASKWKHAFVNVPFILANLPGQLLMSYAFLKTIKFTATYHFGFFSSQSLHKHSFWLFIISFIFLDFGEYAYHVVMHKVKSFWKLHLVHHSDRMLDISTTLREHLAENVVRLSFTLLWVLMSGVTYWIFLLRQLIQAFTTLVAHMNYRLPDPVDRMIGFVFITPNLHQIHHHFKQPYTDSNYGDVLSIWDRLFGTFKRLPAEALVFGVVQLRIWTKTMVLFLCWNFRLRTFVNRSCAEVCTRFRSVIRESVTGVITFSMLPNEDWDYYS